MTEGFDVVCCGSVELNFVGVCEAVEIGGGLDEGGCGSTVTAMITDNAKIIAINNMYKSIEERLQSNDNRRFRILLSGLSVSSSISNDDLDGPLRVLLINIFDRSCGYCEK